MRQKDWPEGYTLASSMNFKFPLFSAIAIETVVTNASAEGIALLTQLLYWNPSKRPTTAAVLRLPYFQKHVHASQPNRRITSHKLSQKSSIPVTQSDYHVNHVDGKEVANMKSSLTYSELGNGDPFTKNGNNESDDQSDFLASKTTVAAQQSRSSTESSLTRASGMSMKDQSMSRSRMAPGQAKNNSRSAREYPVAEPIAELCFSHSS